MTAFTRLLLAACACVLMAATAAPVHAAEPPVRADVVEAVWKAQSVTFRFRSIGRLYPCGMLEAKVKMILLRLGARENLRLQRNYCDGRMGAASYEIALQSPVEATPENVHDVTTYDSREELVARVQGVHLPSAQDVPRFAAAWQTIAFHTDGRLALDSGDCALVQQLQQQLLPKMSVHIVKDTRHVDCAFELGGGSPPRLMVAALVATRAPH